MQSASDPPPLLKVVILLLVLRIACGEFGALGLLARPLAVPELLLKHVPSQLLPLVPESLAPVLPSTRRAAAHLPVQIIVSGALGLIGPTVLLLVEATKREHVS